MATTDSLFTDVGAARSMTTHLDELVVVCQTDVELQKAVLKFQMEHAAAAASYTPPADKQLATAKEHLKATLVRMLDLAVLVASTVLTRATDASSRAGSSASAPAAGKSPLVGGFTADHPPPGFTRSPSPPEGGGMEPNSSSVDDLAAGSDAARTRDAEAMHHAVRVASFVFIVAEDLRLALQMHGLRHGLLDVCRAAVCLPRLTELQFFAEGFKTDHMAVLSNFTFENADVCNAVANDDGMMVAILSATRVDEENPGMVEWAEFCIRNVCTLSSTAREKIATQKPLQTAGPIAALAGVGTRATTQSAPVSPV